MSKRRKNPSRGGVDVPAAHELFLFAVNEADLYRQQITPIVLNLRKKIKKGVYDPALALKLWRYAADTAAKWYTFEFGDRTGTRKYSQKGYGIFNVPTRLETAKQMQDHYDSEVFEGSKTNPRKRRKNPRQLSVPKQHQLKIAVQTLKYSDAGARIMGGMTKAEAFNFLQHHAPHKLAQLKKAGYLKNPLKKGYSRKTVRKNIRHLKRKGRRTKQAVAASLNQARRTFKQRYPGRPLPGFLRRKKNPHATIRYRGKKPRKIIIQRKLRQYAHGAVRSGFAKFFVQVKRGTKWISLGAFGTKPVAVNYGKLLAESHPRRVFRIFW
jgi:hypothetical protein